MKVAMLGIAVALAAVAGASAGRQSGSWASLHRKLQLHALAPGAACPASASHALDHGHLAGTGHGPVYPGPSFFSSYDRAPGWLAAKVIWAWPVGLVASPERVLVRGMRLDGPGPVRFQLGPNWSTPLARELHVDTGQVVGRFGGSDWGSTVTMILVRTPGCYGLQLDSKDGTSTIVLDATRPRD